MLRAEQQNRKNGSSSFFTSVGQNQIKLPSQAELAPLIPEHPKTDVPMQGRNYKLKLADIQNHEPSQL